MLIKTPEQNARALCGVAKPLRVPLGKKIVWQTPSNPPLAKSHRLAFMALLASLCNERSERPKEDASFSYDSASGDLFFSTGKTFWERPGFLQDDSISAERLVSAYEDSSKTLDSVFIGAIGDQGATYPAADALDGGWLLCPHCGDAHQLASVQPFLTCPSCQSISQNPIDPGQEPFAALMDRIKNALNRFERYDSIEDDLGRFLVAIGWAETGILGTIEGVDGDEEAFSYEYVVSV